ncbi:AraC-type DNA-binding protein, response regulator [Paucilactobacillus suebicus DSM 5007 = KCTC 3549]|uniref:AraC-type DNA-binding protein, response regulator n=1 Tax=Paucilactobacillus suebicus DSM 5007 = KCTC 3549 TaxID=1423807 RepID=A0A0R1VU41_9LACO|nr:AraC-type DNA-binding protein, response regulator [Paucilactobacillus suebicus DSM 5007 = KCTC 3549]
MTHAEVRVFNTSTQIDYYGQKRREKSFVNEANIVSLLKKKAKPGVPIIFGRHSVCYALIADRMSFYYLIGPLTTGLDAARLPQVNIKIEQLSHTSSCDTDVWFDELSLLQNMLTNSPIQGTDIYQANNIGAVEVHENALRTTAYFYNNQENNFKHNPYDQEVRELKSIEEGNIERLNDSMHSRLPVMFTR